MQKFLIRQAPPYFRLSLEMDALPCRAVGEGTVVRVSAIKAGALSLCLLLLAVHPSLHPSAAEISAAPGHSKFRKSKPASSRRMRSRGLCVRRGSNLWRARYARARSMSSARPIFVAFSCASWSMRAPVLFVTSTGSCPVPADTAELGEIRPARQPDGLRGARGGAGRGRETSTDAAGPPRSPAPVQRCRGHHCHGHGRRRWRLAKPETMPAAGSHSPSPRLPTNTGATNEPGTQRQAERNHAGRPEQFRGSRQPSRRPRPERRKKLRPSSRRSTTDRRFAPPRPNNARGAGRPD